MNVRRLVASVAVLGLVATVTATASISHSALSRATRSDGNVFAGGTVHLSDNDAGAAVVGLSSVQPGTADSGCILVTYGGSLDAVVRLYGTVSGSLAPYLTLTVTRGTDASPSFDSCASFTADTADYTGAGDGVVYSGPLSDYPPSYETGIPDPPSGPDETWSPGERRSYRLTVRLNYDLAAAGRSSTAVFMWEARNR